MNEDKFTPTEFIAIINQTLDYDYSRVAIVGEVASFKVNQNKWVFFDVKDEESSVPCFMTLWNLRVPLEDGMKVMIVGTPKLTKWGKFSFTVDAVKPVGEGSLKKAYELLKKKLTDEGLFNPEKKRPIPSDLSKLAVISSIQAAGYADFIKIINARWGGMKITVAHTQVQGMDAPDQIIRALNYFNERGDAQMIAILRGGGSADDLSCFNDERLVRAIAASKIPVITGIGHEVDESLADLAADVRASTPSNAAEMLSKDRAVEKGKVLRLMRQAEQAVLQGIGASKMLNQQKIEQIAKGLMAKFIVPMKNSNRDKIADCLDIINRTYLDLKNTVEHKKKLLEVLNPEKVLRQGYAILAGKALPGEMIEIMTYEKEIQAEVKQVKERK